MTVAPYSPPPTRILSWQQLVREADPNYTRNSLQPWSYQFSNGRLFIDPLPLYSFGHFGDLANDNGVLYLLDANNWPMAPINLAPGSLWDNGNTIGIIPPSSPPNPMAAPIIFGQINAFELLQIGGSNLPTSPIGLLPNQLWNNGNEIAVAFDLGLENDGGVLTLTSSGVIGYPTDPTGLAPGAVWNNGGAVAIIAGLVPDPAAPAVLFGLVSAAQLLASGGGNLPTSIPTVMYQIWNNGGEAAIWLGVPPITATQLANNGGLLALDGAPGWPVSDAGLSAGALWSNGGIVSVVGGSVPDPGAPAVYFDSITASDLLALGGANLPTVSPPVGSGQLWNLLGSVCIA